MGSRKDTVDGSSTGAELAVNAGAVKAVPKELGNTLRSIHGLGEAHQLFLTRKSRAAASRHPVAVGTRVTPRPPHRSGRHLYASGSYLGCLTAKRWLGQGWRIRGFGSQSSASFVIRPPFWLRRLSDQRQRLVISARKAPNAAQLVGTAW
jgi:hypothetical protein